MTQYETARCSERACPVRLRVPAGTDPSSLPACRWHSTEDPRLGISDQTHVFTTEQETTFSIGTPA
jgi:hypothetical protein